MKDKKSSSKASTEKAQVAAPRREAYANETGGAPVITATLVVVGVLAALLIIWFNLHASQTTSPALPASSAAKN
jgi:hypothetical protein